MKVRCFLIFVVVIVISFACTSCSYNSNGEKIANDDESYRSMIIGDWELVSTEYLQSASSGRESTADEYNQMASQSLNSALDAVRIVYSFGNQGNFMTYGGMKGLEHNEFAEKLFMVKTAKHGTYSISNGKLTIVSDKGVEYYDIIELSESKLTLQSGEQVMKFYSNEKMQREQEKTKDSTLINR
jgi:hypothetical protein